MKNKKGTRMKKVLALFLSLSLLSFNQPTHAKSMEEYGIFGAGILTTFFGLKLMNNATGKDGTKKQGFFGAVLTACGIAMMAAGPGKVKSIQTQNKGWYQGLGSKCKGKWNKLDGKARKEATLSALDSQISREPDAWVKKGLIAVCWIIENDPTNLIVKNIPWATLLKVNLN